MRLEINIPDGTRLEVKERLVALTKSLNENPDLVENLYLQEHEDQLQALFTKERIAEIDHSLAKMEAGESFTLEQAREHFEARDAEWLSRNA